MLLYAVRLVFDTDSRLIYFIFRSIVWRRFGSMGASSFTKDWIEASWADLEATCGSKLTEGRELTSSYNILKSLFLVGNLEEV